MNHTQYVPTPGQVEVVQVCWVCWRGRAYCSAPLSVQSLRFSNGALRPGYLLAIVRRSEIGDGAVGCLFSCVRMNGWVDGSEGKAGRG